jgi:hypothetical protein
MCFSGIASKRIVTNGGFGARGMLQGSAQHGFLSDERGITIFDDRSPAQSIKCDVVSAT